MLSSIKSFVISLAVSLLIFGLIGYFTSPLLTSVTDGLLTPASEDDTGAQEFAVPEVPEPNKGISGKTAKFADQKSFTMLLVGSDYQPDVFSDYRISVENGSLEQLATHQRHYKADVAMLVRYNAESGVVMFSAIPTNLMVTSSGLQMKLGEVLEKKGIAQFTELVAGIVGLPIDYYICCRISLFANIIDRLGGIKYDVPVDMYYVDEEERIVTPGASHDPIPLVVDGVQILDEDGNPVMIPAGKPFTINLKKGIQTLNGEKATWVLRYASYTSGFAARRSTQISFFRAFFESFARDESHGQLAGIISLINTSNEGDTNMTASDFEELSGTILSYSKYEKTNVDFPGNITGFGAEERITFSRNTVYSVYEKYKLQ